MNLDLRDKIIIVTGGARGIGAAIVEGLAAEGAIPVIVDRIEEESWQLVNRLKASGAKASAFIGELGQEDVCQAAVVHAAGTFGRVDGLVNNAGKNDGVGLEFGSPQRFVQSLETNLLHYYNMVHFALPYLKHTQGSIVNISSKCAVTGQGNTSGYSAAKGAQLALTREWAVELLKYNIRVNAILPAEVMTPLYQEWISTFERPEETLQSINNRIPLGRRMTHSQEIANMAIFLLSAGASHITGQHMFVDGGYVHLDRALDDISQGMNGNHHPKSQLSNVNSGES